MAGLILEKSICGCSLRAASQIIGWLGVVGWGSLSVVVVVRLVMLFLEDKEVSLLFISILLVLFVTVTGYNVLVLMAVKKRRPGLLLPYMLFTMLHVAGGFVRIGISIRHQQYDGFFYVLKAVIDTYCLLLVTSYYSQLRAINREAAAV